MIVPALIGLGEILIVIGAGEVLGPGWALIVAGVLMVATGLFVVEE